MSFCDTAAVIYESTVCVGRLYQGSRVVPGVRTVIRTYLFAGIGHLGGRTGCPVPTPDKIYCALVRKWSIAKASVIPGPRSICRTHAGVLPALPYNPRTAARCSSETDYQLPLSHPRRIRSVPSCPGALCRRPYDWGFQTLQGSCLPNQTHIRPPPSGWDNPWEN